MADLHKKLMQAMWQMQNPKKDVTAKGAKFSYDYATLDQVAGIVKSALKDNGLALSQSVQPFGEEWVLRTLVFDGEQSEVLDTRPYRVISDAQQQGSFETYMRRYALMMVFGLAGEDDDGAAASVQAPQSHSKPQAPKPKAPQGFIEFSALKNRLVAAGMDSTAAGNLLKNELGDPRNMDEEQYRIAIRNGEVLVRSYESNVNQ